MGPPATTVPSWVFSVATSDWEPTTAVWLLQLLAWLGSGVEAERAHASLVRVPWASAATVPVTVTTRVAPATMVLRAQVISPPPWSQPGGVWAVTPSGTESVRVTAWASEGPLLRTVDRKSVV